MNKNGTDGGFTRISPERPKRAQKDVLLRAPIGIVSVTAYLEAKQPWVAPADEQIQWPSPDQEEWIYFLQGGPEHLIKIGHTARLSVRLQNIQGMSPVDLTLVAAFPGTASCESALHRAFEEHRAHFEWFRPAPPVIRFLRDLDSDALLRTPDMTDEEYENRRMAVMRECAKVIEGSAEPLPARWLGEMTAAVVDLTKRGERLAWLREAAE